MGESKRTGEGRSGFLLGSGVKLTRISEATLNTRQEPAIVEPLPDDGDVFREVLEVFKWR